MERRRPRHRLLLARLFPCALITVQKPLHFKIGIRVSVFPSPLSLWFSLPRSFCRIFGQIKDVNEEAAIFLCKCWLELEYN